MFSLCIFLQTFLLWLDSSYLHPMCHRLKSKRNAHFSALKLVYPILAEIAEQNKKKEPLIKINVLSRPYTVGFWDIHIRTPNITIYDYNLPIIKSPKWILNEPPCGLPFQFFSSSEDQSIFNPLCLALIWTVSKLRWGIYPRDPQLVSMNASYLEEQ